jgi:hypothetical protein
MDSVRAEQVLEEILHPAADQRLHLLIAQQPEPIQNIPALQRETLVRNHLPASDGEDGDVRGIFETRSDFPFESRYGHFHLDPPADILNSNVNANIFRSRQMVLVKGFFRLTGEQTREAVSQN